MRISPFGSITGPISLSTTPAIAVGRTAASSIDRMPPREVPTKTAGMRVERGGDRQHVGELDLEAVIDLVAVVFGQAAAAIIERDDAARLALVAGERLRQRVKSAAVRARPGRQTTGKAAQLRLP